MLVSIMVRIFMVELVEMPLREVVLECCHRLIPIIVGVWFELVAVRDIGVVLWLLSLWVLVVVATTGFDIRVYF